MQTQNIPIVRGWHDPYPHCLHRFVLELPSDRNDYFKDFLTDATFTVIVWSCLDTYESESFDI